jgi:hypothetical protein
MSHFSKSCDVREGRRMCRGRTHECKMGWQHYAGTESPLPVQILGLHDGKTLHSPLCPNRGHKRCTSYLEYTAKHLTSNATLNINIYALALLRSCSLLHLYQYTLAVPLQSASQQPAPNAANHPYSSHSFCTNELVLPLSSTR